MDSEQRTADNETAQTFGEEWYQAQWSTASIARSSAESLARTNALIEGATGIATVLAKDINALDTNADCDVDLKAMSSRERHALFIALLHTLNDAQIQMAVALGSLAPSPAHGGANA